MDKQYNLLRALKKVAEVKKKNPGLVEAGLGLLFDTGSRIEHLNRVGYLIEQKSHHEQLVNKESEVKGFALTLLKSEIGDELKASDHLGVLKPTEFTATKYDYSVLMCATLLELKKSFLGLGLGSSKTQIRYNGKPISELEVLQAASILLNWSHLFGTFSTERSLLYYIDSRNLGKKLLNLVPTEFSEFAENIFTDRSMYRFYELLVPIRISKIKDPQIQKCASKCFARFLSFKEHKPVLSWAFKKARQLSYQRIHSSLKIGYSFDDRSYDILINHLLESKHTAYDGTASTVEHTLDQIDILQSEIVFSSEQASVLVFKHIKECGAWLKRHSEASVENLVFGLFKRPVDWPELSEERVHFCRLKLPRTESPWLHDVHTWRDNKHDWKSGSFLYTPSVRYKANIIDLFDGGIIDNSQISGVLESLAKTNEQVNAFSIDDNTKMVWRTIGHFGATLLQRNLVENHSILITPLECKNNHVAYAMAAKGRSPGISKIRQIAESVIDEVRKEELVSLLGIKDKNFIPSKECCWLIFLGKIEIISSISCKIENEIDAAWLSSDKGQLYWTFAEIKKRDGSGANKQLKDIVSKFSLRHEFLDNIKSSHGKIKACRLYY